MKKFSNYQHVEGQEMNERDKKEVGSKFWNEGKWDNFVLPFLPEDVKDMTLVDIGCNAGVFLKLAEDKGFSKVVGVDANKEAYKKALAYKERNGGSYDLICRDMKKTIEHLPAADYTVLANTHYYFSIDNWLRYIDRLAAKSRYCIIVTAKKREKRPKAGSDTASIKYDFRYWLDAGEVPELPLEGDPFPRRQWSFCFKSPLVDRVPIDSLDCGNHVQDGFYAELDEGTDPYKTRYYRVLKQYRKGKWSKKKIIQYMIDKAEMYEDIKKVGLKDPIVVNSKNRIVDGNHRYNMLKHLGHKSILIRRVI